MVRPNPVPPNLRVVEALDLLEHAEDDRVFLRRNADPRIAHREVQVDFAGWAPLTFLGGNAGDLQDHLAALGEFDGVVDEIDHNLPQPMVVADDPARHVLVNRQAGLQPLLFARKAKAFSVSPRLSRRGTYVLPAPVFPLRSWRNRGCR